MSEISSGSNDSFDFDGNWLFLGAESACPMKRKSPVRRQEIM